MAELTYEDVIKTLDENGFAVIPKDSAKYRDKYLEQSEFKYILWLDRIYEKIRTVPGYIVEIGVARGRNAIIFGHLIRMSGAEDVRHYYGFDTFSGYSEEDLKRSPHLSADTWKETTLEFVEERLADADLSDICHIIPGDVKDVARDFVESKQMKFNPGKIRIALLYIDCNAYLAAKFAMEFFKPFMVPGGIICIDEKLQGGETEALIEFCEKHGYRFQRDDGPFGIPAYTAID